MELVRERQKLIKLADSSELGWKVVQEYVANPIAEDSEDEKKMMRAQSRAERKNKSEKMKKGKLNRKVPYTKEKEEIPWKAGRCFNCGKRGHWADSCPEKKTKISTFEFLKNIELNSNIRNRDVNISLNSELKYYDSTNVNKVVKSHVSTCIQTKLSVTDDRSQLLSVQTPVSPVGRLRSNVTEWKLITTNAQRD